MRSFHSFFYTNGIKLCLCLFEFLFYTHFMGDLFMSVYVDIIIICSCPIIYLTSPYGWTLNPMISSRGGPRHEDGLYFRNELPASGLFWARNHHPLCKLRSCLGLRFWGWGAPRDPVAQTCSGHSLFPLSFFGSDWVWHGSEDIFI